MLSPVLARAGVFLAAEMAVAMFGAILLSSQAKGGVGQLALVWWLLWDGLVHLTLEGPFVWLQLTGRMKRSHSMFAEFWREYGKLDARWVDFDTCIVSMEMLTVFFCGPLCFYLVYLVLANKPYRHVVQITLCVCELYGGWMTFGPEWISGNKNLTTSDPVGFWVFLVVSNMVWVVVPLALLKDSWDAVSAAMRATAASAGEKKQQ